MLTWLDLKDLRRHIKILYETTDYDASESLAFNKVNIIICDDYVGLQHQSVNCGLSFSVEFVFMTHYSAGVSAHMHL